MPVTIYRRHLQTCPHKAKGRAFDRCGCPYWADARPIGPLQSLGTRDRSKALEIARDMELTGGAIPSRSAVEGPMTLTEGKEVFFASLKNEALAIETIRKHETLWRQAVEFAKKRDLTFVIDFNASAIDKFVATWKDAALSRGKKIERFRQFFKFAVLRKWIEEDPTKGMKAPKVKEEQTLPFTPNEMTKILAASEGAIRKARTPTHRANAQRMRAMILLLRFSGMRIGDCVSCKIEFIKNRHVQRFTTKNHRWIDVELPANVVQALDTIPARSDLFYFWSGKSTIKTATGKWQKRLLSIFTAAEIVGGHAHRFRDTFAVSMLERGESLQAVADALGNTLKVTEKHYNPWSKTRQARLDEAVRASWKNDPLLKILDDQEKVSRSKGARVM